MPLWRKQSYLSYQGVKRFAVKVRLEHCALLSGRKVLKKPKHHFHLKMWFTFLRILSYIINNVLRYNSKRFRISVMLGLNFCLCHGALHHSFISELQECLHWTRINTCIWLKTVLSEGCKCHHYIWGLIPVLVLDEGKWKGKSSYFRVPGGCIQEAVVILDQVLFSTVKGISVSDFLWPEEQRFWFAGALLASFWWIVHWKVMDG